MVASVRHERTRELFLAVCDLSRDQQTAHLDSACADDPELRTEVEALLSEDSRVENLLDKRMKRAGPRKEPPTSSTGGWNMSFSGGRSGATVEQVEKSGPTSKLPKIPGYEIHSVLGHGGMGIVYQARQVTLNRDVALKVLPAVVGAASPAIVERFRREAAAAAQLRHKNIVPIYDFGQSDEFYYYAMELVVGEPLDVVVRHLASQFGTGRMLHDLPAQSDEFVATRGLNPPKGLGAGNRHWVDAKPFTRGYFHRVASWFADVAEALYEAHSLGIVHRDIKPGNLVVSQDGRLVVTDFGLAMADQEDPITRTGAIMGTLRYLSPEQALGNRVPVDHRTDIYSLGATFYEVLTLCPMVSAADDHQLLAAILSHDPTPPRRTNPSIPPDLETICLKAVEKLPDRRYASAMELAEDLRAFLADRPILARRPNAVARVTRWTRRHKIGAIAAVSIMLLALAAGQLVAGSRRAARDKRVGELISRGLVLQQGGEWAAAAETYLAALDIDADNARAMGNLAIIRKEQYNAQENPDVSLLREADEYCRGALALTPQNAGLWNVQGVILKKLGAYQEAKEAYEAGLDVHGAEPEMRVALYDNLAELLWLLGEDEAAESTVRQAAETAEASGTPSWFVWQDLASLELRDQNAKALNLIQRGFEAKGSPHWRLHVLRARIVLELDETLNVNQAVVDANAALEQAPPDPRIWRVAALAALRSENYASAVLDAQQALRLDDVPAFPHAILAIAEAHRGNIEEAQAHLNQVYDLWPAELEDGDYMVSTERGMLWFDTAWQLEKLAEEARVLINEHEGR